MGHPARPTRTRSRLAGAIFAAMLMAGAPFGLEADVFAGDGNGVRGGSSARASSGGSRGNGAARASAPRNSGNSGNTSRAQAAPRSDRATIIAPQAAPARGTDRIARNDRSSAPAIERSPDLRADRVAIDRPGAAPASGRRPADIDRTPNTARTYSATDRALPPAREVNTADRPTVDRPRAERPTVDRPSVDRPGVDRSGVDRPRNDARADRAEVASSDRKPDAAREYPRLNRDNDPRDSRERSGRTERVDRPADINPPSSNVIASPVAPDRGDARPARDGSPVRDYPRIERNDTKPNAGARNDSPRDGGGGDGKNTANNDRKDERGDVRNRTDRNADDDRPFPLVDRGAEDRDRRDRTDRADRTVADARPNALNANPANEPRNSARGDDDRNRDASQLNNSKHNNNNNNNNNNNKHKNNNKHHHKNDCDDDDDYFAFGFSFGSYWNYGYTSWGFGYSSGGYCDNGYYGSSWGYYRPWCGPRWPVYQPYYCPPVYYYPAYYPTTTVIVTEPEPVVIERTTIIERPTVVYESPETVTRPAAELPPAPLANIDGWDLLRRREPRQAMNSFAFQIERNPGSGLERIGYAIAAALDGDDRSAAVALRDAVASDPGSMIAAPRDDVMAGHYLDLIARYQARAETDKAAPDDDFMIAALAYLHHDFRTAQMAVRLAQAAGDTDATTQQLHDLIRYQLNYQANPNP